MISFSYETDFYLEDEMKTSLWISKVIKSEGYNEGEVTYVFCDDDYLLKLNVEFLKHSTLTDVISFDYSVGRQINGDIFISFERVQDNSRKFATNLGDELRRVMVHGVLHYCGYKDKSKEESILMKQREDYYLAAW